MSDETVRPALTPEEWAKLRRDWHGPGGPSRGTQMLEGAVLESLFLTDLESTADEVHALAAVALCPEFNRGKQFGFTWKDVALLRRRADREEEELAMHGARGTSQLRSLADRIAALLSPETP